ncbi:peptidoglycan DD-metalloendopeptidase family protein [Sedimentitalea sp.]|uniref:peptidoglycan DD-metalloendopeptidase family protein n=1 Tax=Sedimentitalea sp. TaxID=2048915 RepID=UPI003298E4EA
MQHHWDGIAKLFGRYDQVKLIITTEQLGNTSRAHQTRHSKPLRWAVRTADYVKPCYIASFGYGSPCRFEVALMSFNIVFDYSYDTSGFFNAPGRRNALEAAADIWEGLINDDFRPVPVGVQFSIANPSAPATNVSVTLSSPVDDLVVFVGATDLGGWRTTATGTVITGGQGGPSGYDAAGDILSSRIYSEFRGQATTDYEPFAGTISFNSNNAADYSFDISGPTSGKIDFVSTALHEIGHVLGIGTSGAYARQISEGEFAGPNALATNGGAPIPLEADGAHILNGYSGDTALMDPRSFVGTRQLPTNLDLAMLADIGYEISGFSKQGTLPEIVTKGNDQTVFGTVINDTIDGLAGDDKIQGDRGDDHLVGSLGDDILFGQAGHDTLEGGEDADSLYGGDGEDILVGGGGDDALWGGGGSDRYVFSGLTGADLIGDFDFSVDTLVVGSDLGFATVANVLAAVSRPYSNVSRVTFSTGNWVDVYDNPTGNKLQADNIVLQANTFRDPLGDGTPITFVSDTDEYFALRVFRQPDIDDKSLVGNRHLGIDWNATVDEDKEEVCAVASGKVVYAQGHGGTGFGKTVVIEHTLDNGEVVYSLYAHLKSIAVGLGNISIGDKIGIVGDTGAAETPHLHFEIFEVGGTSTFQDYLTYGTPLANKFGYTNKANASTATWSPDTLSEVSYAEGDFTWYNPVKFIDDHRNPTPPKPTEEIFKAEGKAAFLAQLSLAAYHLDEPREIRADQINDQKPYAEDLYTDIQESIVLLGEAEVPIAAGVLSSYGKTTKFGTSGFENGIFTKKNAAALVGRATDAMFISFRGTNDNEGEEEYPPANTPDEHHWFGKDDHFRLFKELIKGLDAYVDGLNGDSDESNDIKAIYVTGHSLGAAMAEAFMTKNWVQKLFSDIPMEAVNFASPGYGVAPGSDLRTTTFWIKSDKILIASKLFDNIGDPNKIFHDIEGDAKRLHSMKLHSDFVEFFRTNGLEDEDFQELHGKDYDRVYAHVKDFDTSYDTETGFLIGEDADTISGSKKNDIILGGKKSDALHGQGGDDYMDGGAGNDTLKGGADWDFLYGKGGKDTLIGGYGKDLMWGGTGGDTFKFSNVKQTNSQDKIAESDRIMDFDKGPGDDLIDLGDIDANWNKKGDQAFDFKGEEAFSSSAGELRYTQRKDSAVVWGDTDGDGVANFAVRFAGTHIFDASDFIL